MKPSQPMEPMAKPFSHDVVRSSAVTNDATGTKEHASSATDQAGSTAVAQGQSTAGKQSQDGASSQDQNATPVQLLVDTSVASTSHGQISASVAPAPAGSTIAGRAGTAATIPGAAVLISTAAPQVSPVINTARLIQSMNQTEMRVGMRSSEFGNISINTLVAKAGSRHRFPWTMVSLPRRLPQMCRRCSSDSAATRIECTNRAKPRRDGAGQRRVQRHAGQLCRPIGQWKTAGGQLNLGLFR